MLNSNEYHIPPSRLEVDSDGEDDQDVKHDKYLKSSEINIWVKNYVSTKNFPSFFKNVSYALHSAVGEKSNSKIKIQFYLKDGKAFNEIIQACLIYCEPALNDYFGFNEDIKPIQKLEILNTIKFKKRKSIVYLYLYSILKLSKQMSSKESLLALVNHIRNILYLTVAFPKLCNNFVTFLIYLWSSDCDETVRILAFLAIITLKKYLDAYIKMSHNFKDNHIQLFKEPSDFLFKKTYKAYILSAHFTSLDSIPMIKFMQKCMIELFDQDIKAAYQFAFINIQKLARKLQEALKTLNENQKLVHNWQYVHSVELWSTFIAHTASSYGTDNCEQINEARKLIMTLINPLVQIITGVIKLVPSAIYIPLRIHLIACLIDLGQSRMFIPVMPLILEMLDLIDFNKEHQRDESSKQINLDLLLKIAKLQVKEKIIKDEVIARVYDLTMDYLINYANLIAFPEITMVSIQQLKKFINNCKVTQYKSSLKQLVNKLQENNDYIIKQRAPLKLSLLKDLKEIEKIEQNMREITPLYKYYQSWKKLRTREILMEISQSEKISDYDHIPSRFDDAASNSDYGSDTEDDEGETIRPPKKRVIKFKTNGRSTKKFNNNFEKQPFKLGKIDLKQLNMDDSKFLTLKNKVVKPNE